MTGQLTPEPVFPASLFYRVRCLKCLNLIARRRGLTYDKCVNSLLCQAQGNDQAHRTSTAYHHIGGIWRHLSDDHSFVGY